MNNQLLKQDSLSDEIKQKIAAELNLSETAFVSKNWLKSSSSSSVVNDRKLTLRWFTPEAEVPLCGHATLATARALFETMEQPSTVETETRLDFQTKFKGILSATMDWITGRISLDFPLAPPIPFSALQLECLPQLLIHLLEPLSTIEVHSVHYSPATKKLLVRIRGELSDADVQSSSLIKLRPNFNALLNTRGTEQLLSNTNPRFCLGNDMVLGIIVTIKGSEDVNFYSRYFAPWVGINEDPVCI